MKYENGEFKFKVKEVAEMFNRSSQWIHLGERQDYWVYPNGDPIVFKRSTRKDGSPGERIISVQNVEDMASALVRRGHLDEAQKRTILAKLPKAI